jgi:hypothetical protein
MPEIGRKENMETTEITFEIKVLVTATVPTEHAAKMTKDDLVEIAGSAISQTKDVSVVVDGDALANQENKDDESVWVNLFCEVDEIEVRDGFTTMFEKAGVDAGDRISP